jgi:hypothetical protein
MSVDDIEHSGRPSTSTTLENIAKVREAILADLRRTIHDVYEIVGEHSLQTSRQVEEQQLDSPP